MGDTNIKNIILRCHNLLLRNKAGKICLQLQSIIETIVKGRKLYPRDDIESFH